MKSKQFLLFFVLILSLVNGLAAEFGSVVFASPRVEAGSALSVTLKSTLARVGKRDLIAIRLSPDARFLAAVTWERKTELWNTQTGQLIATVDGRTFLPYSYSSFRLIDAFSPDGRTLMTISGKEAKLWDAATGRLERVLSGSQDELSSAVFSSDGKKVVTGSKYGTVRLWNVETGKSDLSVAAYEVKKYPRWRVVSRFFELSTDVRVELSPDDKTILTILYDQPAKLWESETGRVQALLGQKNDGGSFSPSGRYVLTESLDGTDLWERATGKLKAHFTSFPTFSPDEHWLGLVEYAGKKGLLNLNAMEVEIPLSLGINNFSTWTRFSPNNLFFVESSGLYGHSATIVDVSSGKLIAEIPVTAKKGFDFISDYLKYWEKLSFHPSSEIMMGANQKLVRFWDTKSGQQIAQIAEARDPAEFSSDGKLLGTASQDKKSILLWEVSFR